MLCVAAADFDAPIWRSKDVPPSDLFLEERASAHLSLYPSKNAMFRWFWEFRCRFDLIDREKYRNPRSMNFQRATTHCSTGWRRYYFRSFQSESLFLLSIYPFVHPAAVAAAEQVQKLLVEKGGSIGNDAFCPVMNYEEERERERGRDVDIETREMRRSVAAQWQWQRQTQQRLTE